MKRIAVLLILAVVATLIYSCRKDVMVEPPPSLSGDYAGTYTFKKGSLPAVVQGVTMKFTTDAFRINWDSTGEQRFCDAKGGYQLTNNVELYAIDSTDCNYHYFKCDLGLCPMAIYQVDQSVANTVKMHSYTISATDTIDRKIELVLKK